MKNKSQALAKERAALAPLAMVIGIMMMVLSGCRTSVKLPAPCEKPHSVIVIPCRMMVLPFMSLTHTAPDGSASMVDISSKPVCHRKAIATGHIKLQPATLELIRQNEIQKGDVIAVARVAGIQAAKQTQHLIPLCHQIALTKVSVDFVTTADGITATAAAKTTGQTGVEMEALTAVSVALLTIYDMCKAVDKSMRLDGVHLVSKTKDNAEQ